MRSFKIFFRKIRRIRRLKRRKKPSQKFLAYKSQALFIAQEKIAHFNQFYNFSVGKITIRNQKTRWGSCSKKGNLNFNYKLALLPTDLADYLVVHELCHIGEFNHSQNFWNLVGKTIQDYEKRRAELKKKVV